MTKRIKTARQIEIVPVSPKLSPAEKYPDTRTEHRDGETFIMFDPRVMSQFRLGSKVIWWRMGEFRPHTLADGTQGFEVWLVRPRGGLAYWAFRFPDGRLQFMGETPNPGIERNFYSSKRRFR